MYDPADQHSDYRLAWPRLLLKQELLAARDGDHPYTDAGLVLAEAFVGRQPAADLRRLADDRKQQRGFWWHEDETLHDAARRFIDELLTHADVFPLPREYWARRHDVEPPETSRPYDHLDLQNSWLALVSSLVEHGYLDRAAGSDCEERGGSEARDRRIGQLLTERAGLPPHSWPGIGRLYSTALSEDSFYTLVEVIHDLVARPRSREIDERCLHDHLGDFSPEAGQALYRWRVDQLFAQYGLDLEIAAEGEDRGLLVRRVADPRQELIVRVASDVPDRNQDLVAHAITLFRRRGATLTDKRSACTSLAHVMEDRTPLIAKRLNTKDASDLTNIANNFGIRHQNAKQRLDYPEAYLDWIFWWFLATVELTNRLIDETTESP